MAYNDILNEHGLTTLWNKIKSVFAKQSQLTDGSVTKVGTTSVGSSSKPIYLNNGTPAQVESIPETLVKWGGRNIKNGVSFGDSLADTLFYGNRLAFSKPDFITIEYSTNGGSSWTPYGATDAQKTNLVSRYHASEFYIGKKGSGATGQDKLRITIEASRFDPYVANVYFLMHKLLIRLSTGGTSGSKVEVETKGTQSDSYTSHGMFDVEGWPEWNSIDMDALLSGDERNFGDFEGGPDIRNHTQSLRLTFGVTGSSSTGSLSVDNVYLYGDAPYEGNQSQMSKTGHIYSYESDQSVEFPADVAANGNMKADNVYAEDNIYVKYGDLYREVYTSGNANNTSTDWAADELTVNDVVINGNEGSSNKIISAKNNNNVITTNRPTYDASIRNALSFKWYNTDWQIGNIRNSSTGTSGFGITKDNNWLVFRVNDSGAWVNGNLVYHAGNIDSTPTQGNTAPVSSGGVKIALDNKVDKVSGKGLSSNDYTTTEKNKLSGIAEGAEVNVQSNWTESDTSSDAYIKNKPTLGLLASKNSIGTSDIADDAITATKVKDNETLPVSVSGNAATAEKLKTPLTIWGQLFDGSGNIDGNFVTSENVVLANSKSVIIKNPSNQNRNILTLNSQGKVLLGYAVAVNDKTETEIYGNPITFKKDAGSTNILGTMSTNADLSMNGGVSAKGIVDLANSTPAARGAVWEELQGSVGANAKAALNNGLASISQIGSLNVYVCKYGRIVCLSGNESLSCSAKPSTLGTLPSEYWPRSRAQYSIPVFDGEDMYIAVVNIATDGKIEYMLANTSGSPVSVSNVFVPFDIINFFSAS